MDLELVNFINSDLTWSAVKKGHRSTMRRPRRTESNSSASGFHSGNKTRHSVVTDYEKSGVAILGRHFAEEVLDVPIKKRILLLQSTGQGVRAQAPQPQISSPHHERPVGSWHATEAVKLTEKAVADPNDFSGIELLAAAACHSSVYVSSGHVDSSAVEEHSIPRVGSCLDGAKQDISPIDSDDSSVPENPIPVAQNLGDKGNDDSGKSPVCSKVVRLHWDLNTVMEEWEEPCDGHNDGLQDEQESLLSVRPEIVGALLNNDGVYLKKSHDADSYLTKSDVIDSFINPTKCEAVSTSTASVSEEETAIKAESDDKQAVSEVVEGESLSLKCDAHDKLTSEDHLSDCCGSNVSQDKVKPGYDSPTEDGELREPATDTWEKDELEEIECVDYESSDNSYEDNSDAIESVTNETVVDHLETIKQFSSLPNSDMEQDDKAVALCSKPSQSVLSVEKGSNSKVRPTSTSCIRRSRSERNFGQEKFTRRDGPSYRVGQRADSISRNSYRSGGYERPKDVRSGGSINIDNNNEAIDYNLRGTYRNESYGIHYGNRDRASGGLRRATHEEYNNPAPSYSERKVPFFPSNFNRSANLSRPLKRSRSRSRSGSPIAWHFQKKRNADTKPQSPSRKPSEIEVIRVTQTTGRVPPQCVSTSFDGRDIINGQYRDRRSSPVRTFHRAHQRHDPPEYIGKSKSNDHFRPRFPSNNDYIHDDKYGMMNERRRFRYDEDESFKGYSRYKDNGFRDTRFKNKIFRDPENTRDERGCRYTTNKMFNTREEHFYKDN